MISVIEKFSIKIGNSRIEENVVPKKNKPGFIKIENFFKKLVRSDSKRLQLQKILLK